MCASLEEAQGVSHHLVAQMEDEYTKVQRTLYPENSGMRRFYLYFRMCEASLTTTISRSG